MNKYAVMDIGSNSVRLMFVADGKILYKTLTTTRLGEGLAFKPLLKKEAILRTANVVTQYYHQALNEGANLVLAFATAAVRFAENGQEFVTKVKELCGLTVEVLSGEEEAEIGILGAVGKADGGVIDIGGASTEIVQKKANQLIYKKSLDIGVVRLKDECEKDFNKLLAQSKVAVQQFKGVDAHLKMYAIGGTATTIAGVVLGLQNYQSNKITGAKLSLEVLEYWAHRLTKLTTEEIQALPCMQKERADVIAGGVVLLYTLVKDLGFLEVIVSDRDNLEGYAIKRGLAV